MPDELRSQTARILPHMIRQASVWVGDCIANRFRRRASLCDLACRLVSGIVHRLKVILSRHSVKTLARQAAALETGARNCTDMGRFVRAFPQDLYRRGLRGVLAEPLSRTGTLYAVYSSARNRCSNSSCRLSMTHLLWFRSDVWQSGLTTRGQREVASVGLGRWVPGSAIGAYLETSDAEARRRRSGADVVVHSLIGSFRRGMA